MATVVQKNGLKPLANGSLVNHVERVKQGGDESLAIIHADGDIKEESHLEINSTEEAKHAIQGPDILNDGVDTCGNVVSEETAPEIDIVINNVVCSFSVRCHLNLRQIALRGANVEYRRENGMVTMKIRKPYTTASVWSSGKVTCTGATSEDAAHVAARRYARCLQKLGFNARFSNFRVVNVLGTCCMPFGIRLSSFSEKHRGIASYEPELHPGVTYKLKEPKATLKIFSTGSVTVTAPSVAFVQAAIEHIFPLVYEFRKERSPDDILNPTNLPVSGRGLKRKLPQGSQVPPHRRIVYTVASEDEFDEEEDDELEDYESDSWE
ncbi:TATA box-binding protein-like 1 [Ischnura elegans]|uniref:TATA box-binding protein-like 1 n=1 Tax=Ischnura elegans TaxID=197161 RepID=UPI001ED88CCA|nr:TATA box-binding protein-like 1 [Ischnura elegans]